MLRLITSRWVRLAAAAAVVAAIVVMVLRLRRAPAVPGAARRAGADPDARSAAAGRSGPHAEAVPPWPPVPILGVPTADDLRRYAKKSYIPGFLSAESSPRQPLDAAGRRRLNRWGAVAAALCLLVFATQALENATFSKETYSSADVLGEARSGVVTDSATGPCDLPDAEPQAGLAGTYAVTLCDMGMSDGDLELPAREELSSDATPGPRTTPGPAPTATGDPDGSAPDADCHPAARAPRVRALSPRMVRAVGRQWARIERWLKANDPASYRTLGPPARARTIAVAEAQMGLRFPDDLRASLLRHNGAAATGGSRPFGFLGNMGMGVREIRDTWRMLCGIDDIDEGDPRAEWWDGRMIPFGSDGSGNHLVVDSVRRDVGDTDHEGQLSFTPGGVPIRSHYALLKATADAMETGGSVSYWRPAMIEGGFDWEIVD
ncbi:SMI1/KNR4 family protein [Streptosporangium sp. NBC_01756]|uniref:SMI1/KNR4 family protein n=1 Tax=Streptosporangium sp. NBC_01756 TaxID=2975950 RepID=UPI002DD99980|nr:SMI1/KNR4 family protein [Streptosporangium sp. NBC_01756]WSC84878.1 SMI1/KNR4 family protein [Streptosporangium sp. NBC_01756]